MIRLTAIAISSGLFCNCALIASPPLDYTITSFSDEFNGVSIDANKWITDPNRPNVSVASGMLTLTTEDLDSSRKTGQVWSTHTQRYGYWEARYTIGEETGLNNSFWLNTPHGLIQEEGNVSGGQTIDRMEIDIQETHYPDELNMNLHDWAPTHIGKGSSSQHVGGNLSTTFHTYGLEWRNDNSMAWYFDGVEVFMHSTGTVNSIRNMIPMETLFSTLVTSFADPPGPNLDGTTMDVDWVRVWQKPGWTGDINGNWGSGPNWGPDGTPGTNDAAIFNQPTANTTISLASDKSVREVYFRGASTPAFTFAEGNTLHLGSVSSSSGVGGVTIDSDVTNHQIFEVDITADADLMFGNYSRTQGVELQINGYMTTAAAGSELFFGNYDEQPIIVNGSIGSGFSGLTKFKTGSLRLSSSNGYTGLTDIRNGKLEVIANNALGAAGGTNFTQVNDGATISFAGGVHYSTSESIHLEGDGVVGSTGAFEVSDNSSVAHHGPVWLDGDVTIGSGTSGGSLILAGAIQEQGGSRSVSIKGNGAIRFTATNNYTGTTHVDGGTLAIEGAGSIDSSLQISLANGTTFDVAASNGGSYSIVDGQTLSGSGRVVGNLVGSSGSMIKVAADSFPLIPDASIFVGADFNDLNLGPMGENLGQPAGTGTGFESDYWSSGTSVIRTIQGDLVAPAGTNYAILQQTIGDGFVGANSVGGQHASADRQQFRSISPLSGNVNNNSEIWFSFLVQNNQSTDVTGIDFDSFSVINWLRPLVMNGDKLEWNEGTGTASGFAIGDTHLVVGQIINGNAGINGDDTLNVWVNPDVTSLATLGAPDLAVTNEVVLGADDTLTSIGLQSRDTEPNGTGGYLDAVYFSDSSSAFAEVTTLGAPSLMPQPGVYSLVVEGDYTHQSGATLEIDIFNPTTFEQLAVEGTLTAGGTLKVEFVDEAPSATAGDSFEVLAFDMSNGEFETLILPLLGAGLNWNASNLLTAGVLSVQITGDYNGDGHINAADYTVWRDTLGQSGISLAADGNGNGMIDMGDYELWRLSFLSTGTPVQRSKTIPEPASLALIISLIFVIFSCESRPVNPASYLNCFHNNCK